MIKAGDLVGWTDHFDCSTPEGLDDFGVVVSIVIARPGGHSHGGLPELKRIRIAWRRDPEEAIDEYPFCWAEGEMEAGALVILSRS